jgi:hypothetical protein
MSTLEQWQIDARERDAKYGPQWHNLGPSGGWRYADKYALTAAIELGERVTDESEAYGWTKERDQRSRDIWASVLADSWREELDIAAAGYMWRIMVTESDWDMGCTGGSHGGTVGPARNVWDALDLVRDELKGYSDEIEEDGTDPPALRIPHPCDGCEDDDDDPHGWDEIFTVEPVWSY